MPGISILNLIKKSSSQEKVLLAFQVLNEFQYWLPLKVKKTKNFLWEGASLMGINI